jgi:hypothetical protein
MTFMTNLLAWLEQNYTLVLTSLLLLSEAAAALVQLIFPQNKGVSGVLAALIKFLQVIGAKERLEKKNDIQK